MIGNLARRTLAFDPGLVRFHPSASCRWLVGAAVAIDAEFLGRNACTHLQTVRWSTESPLG